MCIIKNVDCEKHLNTNENGECSAAKTPFYGKLKHAAINDRLL